MSASSEKRIAIVGSVEPATRYRMAIAELPELVPDAAASVSELLERGPLPELAVICTPIARRADEADLLLRGGVDVLVSNPLAAERSAALCIVELAERLARTLMTAAPWCFFDAVSRAQELIRAGRIGSLHSVVTTLTRKLDLHRSPPGGPNGESSGIWMNAGPDGLDLIEALAGPLERLWMVRQTARQGAGVEDEARVEAEHAGGVRSRIELSWNAETPEPIARCIGERGEIIIGWAQSLVRCGEEERVFASGYDEVAAYRRVLEQFLRERMDSEPREDHGDQALAWLEAGYRSHETQRWEIA